MPNITDADVFTDPVDYPGDGDAITSASVLQHAQDLANRTRYLLNAGAAYATYTVSGTSTFSSVAATLTAVDEAGGISSSANLITLPVGIYLISLGLAVQHGDTNNPQNVNAGVLTNSSISWSGHVVASALQGTRFSATTSHLVGLSGTRILNVTNSSTQKVFVSALGSGTVTFGSADYNKLVIQRVGR